MKSLGERLKVLRNERGLVQQDMADFLKCRVRNYQAIEAGEVNPRLPKLIELADYFGVSVDYLLGRTLPAIPGPVTCRRGAQRPKASHRGGFQRRPQSLPPAGGKVSRRMP